MSSHAPAAFFLVWNKLNNCCPVTLLGRRARLLLLTVAGKGNCIALIPDKHRCEVAGTFLIKFLRFANFVSAGLFLPIVNLRASVFAGHRYVVVRMRLQIQIVVLDRVFVLALILLHLCRVEIDNRVLQLVLAAQRTLVTVCRTRVVQDAVALALLECRVTLQLTVLLRRQTAVALLIHIRRGKILTDGELLIRPLDLLLHTTTAQTKYNGQKTKDYYAPSLNSHSLNSQLSSWITNPERNFGSNHVVFGGIMFPLSAMSMICCIVTG